MLRAVRMGVSHPALGTSLGLVACLTAFQPHQALSQLPITVAGTLTCTVADVPGGSSGTVDLSCNFRSHTGLNADYVGTARTRTGGFPPAKHVFVWTVVAVDAGKAPLLDGTFQAGPSQQGAAVLVGGNDGSLRLEPVPDNAQVPGPSEITSLSLKAATTKT
jgi:hypothetical protein